MKGHASLSLMSFILLFSLAFGATLQSSNGLQLESQSNVTNATISSAFYNQMLRNDPTRYRIPGSPIALDFYDYTAMKSIIPEDVLMAIIEGLTQIFGKSPAGLIPELNTFNYKNYAFVHIQDLNPTVGREHTYADMATILKGIAEYMTEFDHFKEMEFQIWSLTQSGQAKIGSGAVGGSTPSRVMQGEDSSTS